MANEKRERTTLAQAAEAGKAKAKGDAKFESWSRLRDRTMKGRFSDGTVVFRGQGRAWVYGQAAE